MNLRDRLIKASSELGIIFRTPFAFSDKDGNQIDCIGLVQGFGSPKGTIVISEWKPEVVDFSKKNDYDFSCMSDYDEEYDKNEMIDTLDDWGWFGYPKKEPEWYTGKAWTE